MPAAGATVQEDVIQQQTGEGKHGDVAYSVAVADVGNSGTVANADYCRTMADSEYFRTVADTGSAG